jgi:hypothetical protein
MVRMSTARPRGGRPRALGGVAMVLVTSLVLAACGATTTTSPGTSAQVRRAWTTFFKGSTPVVTRLALLQDSSAFSAAVRAQSSSAFAKSISVSVTHVQIRSSTTAKVTYTIRIGGVPELPGQVGEAVWSAGAWKVSAASFCGLLALERVVPAVCASG